MRRPWWTGDCSTADGERPSIAGTTLADYLYRGSLRRNQRTVAAAVQAILEAPSGPVVVHCRSGVDRTGMLIAVILDSVGVSRSLIAEDYATFTSAPGLPAGDPPTAPTMTQTLAQLDRDHGGSVAYLRGCGLAADVGTRLAERLTS